MLLSEKGSSKTLSGKLHSFGVFCLCVHLSWDSHEKLLFTTPHAYSDTCFFYLCTLIFICVSLRSPYDLPLTHHSSLHIGTRVGVQGHFA